MTYISYRIRQGDTLDSIASDLLGSADRWREIAVLNRLRYPFISDDPIDQYGQPIVTGTLSSAIAANATTYQFQANELPLYATTYSKGCVFYIESATSHDAMALSADIVESTGVLTFVPSVSLSIQDAITASAIPQEVTVTNVTGISIGMLMLVDTSTSQETVTITAISAPDADVPTVTALFTKNHNVGTLASYGFQNSYTVGTPFSLFASVRDQRLKVLRVGDYLQLPTGAGASSVAQTGDALFVDLLGVDIFLGSDGQMVLSSIGDVTRVSGTKNLAQALRLRLATPSSSYDHYPDYGNPLWDFLGHTTEPYFVALVEGLVRSSLLQDPRVGAVRNIAVTVNGSTVTVDCQVEILQSSELLRLENLVVAVGR